MNSTELDIGHFSQRWHHHAVGHDGCPHTNAAPPDDLGHMGLVLSVGRAVGGLAALGWTVYAARRLQGDWGRLSTVLAYAAVASVATDLGIPLALTELSCRHQQLDRSAVFAAMRRRVAVGSIAAIALVFAWANTSGGTHWGLAALYGISVTVTPITGSFLALLRGRAIAVVEAFYEAGRQIALPALGIAAIQLGLGVWGVLGVYVVIDVVSALTIAVLARRRLGLSAEVDVEEEHELGLRETIPLSATGIVGNAYERVDSALLAPLAGIAAVGIYRMVTPIVGAVLMPAKAIGDTAAVAAGRSDTALLRATAARYAIRAILITLPVAVVLAIVGPTLLSHVLRAHATASNRHPINWSAAAGPLRILLLTAIPSAALATLTPVALVAQRRRIFHYALGALVANMLLNVLLVPSFGLGLGASGAALAFLATEAILAIVLWSTLPAANPVGAGRSLRTGGVGAIESA